MYQGLNFSLLQVTLLLPFDLDFNLFLFHTILNAKIDRIFGFQVPATVVIIINIFQSQGIVPKEEHKVGVAKTKMEASCQAPPRYTINEHVQIPANIFGLNILNPPAG